MKDKFGTPLVPNDYIFYSEMDETGKYQYANSLKRYYLVDGIPHAKTLVWNKTCGDFDGEYGLYYVQQDDKDCVFKFADEMCLLRVNPQEPFLEWMNENFPLNQGILTQPKEE